MSTNDLDTLVSRLRQYNSPSWGSALKDMHEAADKLESMALLLDRYKTSWSSLRDWAQECRDKVLYRVAQEDSDLGRIADSIGQASTSVLPRSWRKPEAP